MCGIAGSLNWGRYENESHVKAMCQQLAHRGPDAEKVVSLGPMILGHRRLSIIDISPLSNQPMSDNTGRYWIVFNGELYNFKELKAQLLNAGHEFKTASDTEVILESYKRYGAECLQLFTGMFAFAIWDKLEESLFLARDRMGEKPLYYATFSLNHNETNLIFASELKALALHPQLSYRINYKAVSQFLSLNYILSDSCIIEGVEKLPPAHYLLLRKGQKPEIKSYWDLSVHFKNKKIWKSKREAQEALNELIQETVQAQMISDVPLGAFLSGGIDSSTVVSAMRKIKPAKEVQTFSIGFHEKSYNELAESQQVAEFLGVSHHVQYIDEDRISSLTNIIQTLDEPFADNSLLPTYFLAEFSRKYVKVCLSGDGGDELFLGYETYAADKLHQAAQYLPRSLLKLLSSMVDRHWPVSHHKISLDYKLKQFLKGSLLDYHQAHYFWRQIFSDQEKFDLLKADARSHILQHNPFHSVLNHYNPVLECHPLDQSSYLDMKTWMVDDILVKVDRLSMAHSLEVRAPFLNHHLVEFAASLPVHWKMNFFQKKHLLKLSQAQNLPKSILHRSKKGFNAPISPWFSGKLYHQVQDSLFSNAYLKEWIEPKAMENLWKEHTSGRKDNGFKLFGLLCLGLWLENAAQLFANRNIDAHKIETVIVN